MGDELQYIKTEIASIVSTIRSSSAGAAALRPRGVQDGRYLRHARSTSPSLDDFRKNLNAQSAGGGATRPSDGPALLEAGKLEWRDDDTRGWRSSSPTLRRTRSSSARRWRRSAHAQGVAICPVAASGTDDACELVMRATRSSPGAVPVLTDDSGIGLPRRAALPRLRRAAARQGDDA
jgi:hypothetical protein